jgi:two-component system sensor histidine kinase BaeS
LLRRFRFRVFALVVLVAVVATVATAWLSARAATAQFAESATVQKKTSDLIHQTVAAYGSEHGTWEGIDRTVRGLGERTGQRIRLTTLEGEVIADTDTLAGRTARASSSQPATVVDPRPQPPSAFFGDLTEISNYRTGLRTAACLTHNLVDVNVTSHIGSDGQWTFDLPDSTATGRALVFKQCFGKNWSTKAEQNGDQLAWKVCVGQRLAAPPAATQYPAPSGAVNAEPRQAIQDCARSVFVSRLESAGAVPLQLKLGFGVDRVQSAGISPRRLLTAAGLVALLVIAGTVLLSRRVLSSLEDLSRASRRLAAGDLAGRVKVRGDDEIAELAMTFNRMADSLQRSEEIQRRMINDLAHELRTPLANIRGYLEAMHDGVLEPDRELFASLHEEAVLQQRLIDDLQDLAIAESGGLRLQLAPLDAAELLETCRTAQLANAKTRDVRIELDVSGSPMVNGDPDRLRQAIGNLMTNALRATPAGGTLTLGARVAETADRRRAVVISVADTGHGIAPDHLDHIFDRFWRADEARGRDTGGRGLGLSITREIVLAHRGLITAASTSAAGSTFTITLPALWQEPTRAWGAPPGWPMRSTGSA